MILGLKLRVQSEAPSCHGGRCRLKEGVQETGRTADSDKADKPVHSLCLLACSTGETPKSVPADAHKLAG